MPISARYGAISWVNSHYELIIYGGQKPIATSNYSSPLLSEPLNDMWLVLSIFQYIYFFNSRKN